MTRTLDAGCRFKRWRKRLACDGAFSPPLRTAAAFDRQMGAGCRGQGADFFGCAILEKCRKGIFQGTFVAVRLSEKELLVCRLVAFTGEEYDFQEV